MTIPEIQALKAELEVALLQAFTDFQRLTGVAVDAVDLRKVEIQTFSCLKPEKYLTQVIVELESL